MEGSAVGFSVGADWAAATGAPISVGAGDNRYMIQRRGDVVAIEKYKGMTFELPIVVFLAGSALLISDVQRSYQPVIDSTFGASRSSPSRIGESWLAQEDDALAVAFSGGQSLAQLAESHARTRGGIRARLEKLGLIDVRQRRSEWPSPPAATGLVTGKGVV